MVNNGVKKWPATSNEHQWWWLAEAYGFKKEKPFDKN
jgi:hypothetical protein